MQNGHSSYGRDLESTREIIKICGLEMIDVENYGTGGNPELTEAYGLIENSKENLLIIGRAGTGKSTLTEYFAETARKNVIVLAFTGVAAQNIGGQTIHSFFRFGIDITPKKVKEVYGNNKKLYKNIDTIFIDEISMVRADLLDCVDQFLRINGPREGESFGGVQMVFVGDLFQLPPVVTREDEDLFKEFYKSPYFFDSSSFNDSKFQFRLIELYKNYRQADPEFTSFLDRVRVGEINDGDMDYINKRVTEDPKGNRDFNKYPRLVTTNAMAKRINDGRLETLSGKLYVSEATITGDYREKNPPADRELRLKKGARIMIVTNSKKGDWRNGDTGTIAKLPKLTGDVKVNLDSGKNVVVSKYTWDKIKHYYDKKSDSIETKKLGSFTQYPIKLAWAVTIHKGQGSTLENVVIDFGNGAFTSGQAYVALSRCTSYAGISLESPVDEYDLIVDKRIIKFLQQFQ